MLLVGGWSSALKREHPIVNNRFYDQNIPTDTKAVLSGVIKLHYSNKNCLTQGRKPGNDSEAYQRPSYHNLRNETIGRT